MTHTDNGTSCATCSEVRRNTRRIAARRKTCGFGVDPLHYPNVRKFPKQITSSCTFGISTMFCVVSPGSKYGDVLSLISKLGDVLKSSTAASARYVSQSASRIVKVGPRLLVRLFTKFWRTKMSKIRVECLHPSSVRSFSTKFKSVPDWTFPVRDDRVIHCPCFPVQLCRIGRLCASILSPTPFCWKTCDAAQRKSGQ